MSDATVYIDNERLMSMKEVDRKLYKILTFQEKVDYLMDKFKQKYFPNSEKGLGGSV